MLARARDAVGGASVLAIAAGVALGVAFSRLVEVTANTVYNVQFARPDFAGEGFVRRFAFAFGDYVLDFGPVLVSLVAFLVVLGAVVLVFRRPGIEAESASPPGSAPSVDEGAPAAGTATNATASRR